jgi:hypothetical protein
MINGLKRTRILKNTLMGWKGHESGSMTKIWAAWPLLIFFFFFFEKPTGRVQIWCMQEHLKPVSPEGCNPVWDKTGGTAGCDLV